MRGVGTRSSVHPRVRYSYAVCQQVPVYDDPAAPSAAVRVKGIQPCPVAITLSGVLFIALGRVAFRVPSLATRPWGSR